MDTSSFFSVPGGGSAPENLVPLETSNGKRPRPLCLPCLSAPMGAVSVSSILGFPHAVQCQLGAKTYQLGEIAPFRLAPGGVFWYSGGNRKGGLPMKRLRRIGMILAFLAVCAGALLFLLRFTQSVPAFTYPTWETGAVVSPSGEETPFDPAGLPPDLGEGEAYRFTLTLPAERVEGTYLVFEAAGLAVAAYLDGQEVWRSSSDPAPETANQSQVQLPLPAGGGEALVIEVRPLSALAILPPLARLSTDPTDQAGAVAYANYYGLPAGATALALVLLWGLFLLGLSQGKGTWPLLLPTLAAALLTAHRMALGYGNGFLPQPVQALLSAPWLEWVAALALVGFLVLHRERAFWKALGIVTAWSAGGWRCWGWSPTSGAATWPGIWRTSSSRFRRGSGAGRCTG